MTRFVEDRFSDIHLSTIGVDFKTVTTMLDGKIVKLHIWDTAGQERFAQVTTHYYRGADGAILVYDTTNAQSFESIENWVEAVKNANSQPVVMLLVGNKNDLVDERQVSRQSGEELASQLNAPFMETSARDSSNVDVTFLNLAKTLVNTRYTLFIINHIWSLLITHVYLVLCMSQKGSAAARSCDAIGERRSIGWSEGLL